MRQTYFPSTDAGLLLWAQRLTSILSQHYADYGVSQQQAQTLSSAVATYESAYHFAAPRETRTMAAVQGKNDARETMKAQIRLIVYTIRGQAHVTSSQQIELGLTVPKQRRGVVAPPESPPQVSIVSTCQNTVTIKVTDQETSSVRRRAEGATGAQIFVHVGEEPPVESTAWAFYCNTSKTNLDVILPDTIERGARVWFTARWTSRRGHTSESARPVCTCVASGATVPRALKAA